MKKKLFFAFCTLLFCNVFAQSLHQWNFTNGSLLDTGTATTKAHFGIPPTSTVTTTTDAVGNANNAINVNSVNTVTGAAAGNNSINMTLGNASANNYRFVLGFNIKTATNDANERIILDQTATNTNANGYNVSLKDGKIQLKVRLDDGGTFRTFTGIHPTAVADGAWHRVVVLVQFYRNSSIRTTNRIRIYVDNSLYNVLNLTNTVLANLWRVFISNDSELVLGNNNTFAAPTTERYVDGIDNIEILENNLTTIPNTFYYSRLPKIIYVNLNATGNNDGSSWVDAYTSLKDAIDNAIPKDEIWLAAGTYKPGTSRTDTFTLKDGMKIYGGFSGTETNLSDRNLLNNTTVLSGDVLGNDSGGSSTKNDNVYRILVAAEDNVIDGFTFKGGHANLASNSAYDRGAAIYKTWSAKKITVKNCKFIDNYTYTRGAVAAVYSTSSRSQSLMIENCEFSGNRSGYGAGFSAYLNSTSSTLNVTVINSLFYNNSSFQTGSGGSISGSAFAVLTPTSGTNNVVNVTVNNTTITHNNDTATNTSTTETGPVMLRSGNTGDNFNVTLNNSIITQNTHTGSTKPSKTFSRGNTTNKITSLTLNNSKVDEVASGGFSGNSLNASFAYLVNGANFSEANMLNSTTTVAFNNPTANDFSLNTTDTALIDTGDNSLIPAGITTDLLFDQRIANTTVDMGCYEFGSTSALSNDLVALNDGVNLSVYPNPTLDDLFIQTTLPITAVKLLDVNGKVYFSGTTKFLQLGTLPAGVYILNVYLENTVVTKKIIKI